MFNPRFLIVSLGNQAPYYESLHSAGHLVLKSVQAVLRANGEPQPPFTKQDYGNKRCLASEGRPYTMIQSPTMMNLSGPWVSLTWQQMLARNHLRPWELSLVVVHDDLEEAFGTVKVRKWKTSARGHNGVRSTLNHLKISQFPGARWSRISVGIGRPKREGPVPIIDYVLRQMTDNQKMVILDQAGPKVLECLRGLQDDWEKNYDQTTPKL
ncbi:peptidyl-tRNA hydrolase [Xylariaceae sp. FL0662B]|nr:peptidyl-tRNA hydrolase [Xylariaceae sp. FL0662B]